MSIRRLFWLGAAVVFAVAALVAIAAVLGGDFGETQWKVLATCAIVFVTGSTALAGFASVDRGVFRPAGITAIVLGLTSFTIWTAGLWSGSDNASLWKISGVVAAWMVAALITTTLRLLTRPSRLAGVLLPATIGTACVGAIVGSVMIVSEESGPWQLLVVLVILTLLGYLLTPVLQRFSAAGGAEKTSRDERMLGSLGNIDVIAIKGDGRSLRIGDRAVRLGDDEAVVLRPR